METLRLVSVGTRVQFHKICRPTETEDNSYRPFMPLWEVERIWTSLDWLFKHVYEADLPRGSGDGVGMRTTSL
jgi:hypothetical protein